MPKRVRVAVTRDIIASRSGAPEFVIDRAVLARSAPCR
jgi:hypothetical protein